MNDAAFAEALLAARPVVRACARKWLRDPNESEDLAQDTLLLAWERRRQYRPQPGKSIAAWLGTICWRRMLDHRRKLARHAPMPFDEDRAPALDGGQEARILIRDLRAVAERKAPGYGGAALVDLLAEGHDYDALAAHFDVPLGTLKSRVARTRAALLQEMA